MHSRVPLMILVIPEGLKSMKGLGSSGTFLISLYLSIGIFNIQLFQG